MPLRAGVLGTGKIATHFARSAAASRRFELYAVASRDEQRAERFAQKLSVARSFGDYSHLVRCDDIDAVYVALPHTLHAEWAIAAASNGKHVLCEKPLAMNAAQVRDVLAAVQRADVALMEGFAYRFSPATAKMRTLLEAGVIGELHMMDATFGYNAGAPDNYLFRPELGGGSILDVGCYTTSMARLIAGIASSESFDNPLTVSGALTIGAERVERRASACLLFQTGFQARLGCAIDTDLPDRLTVHGSEGSLSVTSPWLPGRLGEVAIEVEKAGRRADRQVMQSLPDLYAAEADAFVDAVSAREHTAMSWADSLGNAETLDAWRACTTPSATG